MIFLLVHSMEIISYDFSHMHNQHKTLLLYLPRSSHQPFQLLPFKKIMVWFKCASRLCHIDNVCVLSFFVSTPNDFATFACITSRSSSMTNSISNWYVILPLGSNSLSCTKNLVTLSPFFTPFRILYYFSPSTSLQQKVCMYTK